MQFKRVKMRFIAHKWYIHIKQILFFDEHQSVLKVGMFFVLFFMYTIQMYRGDKSKSDKRKTVSQLFGRV